MVFKWIERKPVVKIQTYLKFGFVVTEHECHLCPRCGSVLNAGPDYHPQYCSECGQKISFKGILWREDKEIRYLPMVKEGLYE